MKDFYLGVDIEEVKRFQGLLRNRRFLNRVFSPGEIAYCNKKKNRAQHFAVRFAAKEAVWKALSDVIRQCRRPVGHRDISIKNTLSGKPEVILPKALSSYSKRVQVSLSHTKSYAVAMALVRERDE
jgi:holo-[acyl-carrier protein] synthase